MGKSADATCFTFKEVTVKLYRLDFVFTCSKACLSSAHDWSCRGPELRIGRAAGMHANDQQPYQRCAREHNNPNIKANVKGLVAGRGTQQA